MRFSVCFSFALNKKDAVLEEKTKSPNKKLRFHHMSGTSFMVLWMKCTWKPLYSFYDGHFALIRSRSCPIHERTLESSLA